MLLLPPSVKIFIASRPVDMRRGFDGLAAMVRDGWGKDVYSGHLFVFVGARGDRIKVLFWDRGGFVLYAKRLERGRFRLPPLQKHQEAVELSSTQLAMVLDGLDVAGVREPRRWLPPIPA